MISRSSRIQLSLLDNSVNQYHPWFKAYWYKVPLEDLTRSIFLKIVCLKQHPVFRYAVTEYTSQQYFYLTHTTVYSAVTIHPSFRNHSCHCDNPCHLQILSALSIIWIFSIYQCPYSFGRRTPWRNFCHATFQSGTRIMIL